MNGIPSLKRGFTFTLLLLLQVGAVFSAEYKEVTTGTVFDIQQTEAPGKKLMEDKISSRGSGTVRVFIGLLDENRDESTGRLSNGAVVKVVFLHKIGDETFPYKEVTIPVEKRSVFVGIFEAPVIAKEITFSVYIIGQGEITGKAYSSVYTW